MKGFQIGRHEIGPGKPVFIIAEMSANHGQDIEKAKAIIRAAAQAGADAVKLQTYTADTLTIDHESPCFTIAGTLWEGRTLYNLYQEACTPWEWYPLLRDEAERHGLELFSTPFDTTAVDFLAGQNAQAYKIASFELVDIPLITYVACQKKPLILSTGMATIEEIEAAMAAVHAADNDAIALLKCTSAYPAPAVDLNLRTIADMAARFDVPVGLSDHTQGTTAAVAAVTLGACIIEKHITLKRADGGPDAAFSAEPAEFASMVRDIRTATEAIGRVSYGPAQHELASLRFRRSLFVVEDIYPGDLFTEKNVRSIRPADGLSPKYLPAVIGRRAVRSLSKGTPLKPEDIIW